MQQDEKRVEQETANAPATNDSETPLLEWVVACIGILLVAGAVAFLLYKAIWRENSPPAVVINVASVVQMSNGYLVQFQAVNQGGSTAEGVVIQGALKKDGLDSETSHTTLDYLPAHSEVRGGLFFTQDPRQFDFRVRAFGYEEP